MIDFSKFTDGIPFSAFRDKKKTLKKKKKKSRSPSRKRRRTRRTKRRPMKVPPKGVIIRKRNKLYKSDGKKLTLLE
jgi:hypothetical protein